MAEFQITRGGFRRRAATPVEVLASLIVAALVLSLFMAAGRRARNLSVMAAERGNLRVIAQLMAKYSTNDPRGIIGPVHPEAGNFLGDGYIEYGGGPGSMPFTNWNDEFDPRTRPFNDLLYGKNAVQPVTEAGNIRVFREYQCLGNDLGWQEWSGFLGDHRETENRYFGANGSSYRMNNLALEQGIILGIIGRPRQHIPFPAATLALFEARTYQTLWTNDTWGAASQGELLGYHDRIGYFLTAYTDGHNDFVDFGDGTYYQQQPGANELDFRGTWGRMDCLPDALTFGFNPQGSVSASRPLIASQRIEEESQP